MEIVNLILSSEENFKSALELEKNLSTAKAEKMKQTFNMIDAYVNTELMMNKFGDEEEKNIEVYYSNKKSYPYPSITYKIADIDSKNNIGLYLKFEINWNLYMGIAIAEFKNNKLEYLKPEKYMGIVQQYVNNEYIKYDENWICWNYILDSKGKNYDFKAFTANIVELDEKENYEEVEFFRQQIGNNIKNILR